MMRELIIARGHENIKAAHPTTLEITKDSELTLRGDCIIGVSATKSISELSDELKEYLKKGKKAEIHLNLPEYGISESLSGYGSEKLTFDHKTDIVIRRSKYVCGRTLLISASKAARDLDREFIKLLRDRKTELHFEIVLK
jgi:hypothetical protein